MIEILKKGPEKFVRYCPHCGAKLQYELSDVTRVFCTDSYVVNCPVCKYIIQHRANGEIDCDQE